MKITGTASHFNKTAESIVIAANIILGILFFIL